MRIIQITDLHIGHPREMTFNVDVRGNFQRALQKVLTLSPDHLVISGDLCYREGHRSIYQWIKDQLDELSIPYDLISGNHDDPILMAQVFELEGFLKGNELYYERRIGDQPVLFLDTTHGAVSKEQQNWLRQRLSAYDQELILFMHHPPLFSGVPYMDNKYALKNQPEVLGSLRDFPHRLHIFTGHYHVDKVISSGNLTVYITPSLFFQISQHVEDFQVDHRRIGIREIAFWEEALMSTVIYLE